jgi:hypothetical protein
VSKFRLVILDNAKAQLENQAAKTIMSDVVFIKQKNFLRSEPNYVVTDKHDMIGTHYLIYDTTHFLEPKLIFAIRTTFLSRALQHRVETPLMSIVPRLSQDIQNTFESFHDRHRELVDCNAWFVDPDYSKKNSGLNLSALGYFMVCSHVMRVGGDNIVGCTNETYNASRWVEPLGKVAKGLVFEHPAVKSPHMMLLVENFNMDFFGQIYQEYADLIAETFEIFPEQKKGEEMIPFSEFCRKTYAENSTRRAA